MRLLDVKHLIMRMLIVTLKIMAVMDIVGANMTTTVKKKIVSILLPINKMILVMMIIFILRFLLITVETIFIFMLIFLSLREGMILMILLIG